MKESCGRSKKAFQDASPAVIAARAARPAWSVNQAINSGMQKFTNIPVPVLAIFAFPHDFETGGDAAARAAQEASDMELVAPQMQAFERGVPTARVVRIPHANHYRFLSNEADVLKEINAFVSGLP